MCFIGRQNKGQMGLCASSKAAAPTTLDVEEEGEVEAGAEDRTKRSSERKIRTGEEDDFGNFGNSDVDLEELGVEENTLNKLHILDEDQQEKLTLCMASHFKDNDTMTAYDLGILLGLIALPLTDDDEPTIKPTAPLFVQHLHKALQRVGSVNNNAPESDSTIDDGVTMGVTEAVEAFLHVHGHTNDVEKQSDFLYNQVYGKGSVDVNAIQLLHTHNMATSLLESAVNTKEFKKDFGTLGLMNVDGEIEDDVKKIIIEHLNEELSNGNNTIVSKEKFKIWVEKCLKEQS